MKREMYPVLLNRLSEMIDEGILCVDEKGVAVFYNEKMGELEDMKADECIGKTVLQLYPDLNENTSTLLRAILRKESTLNKQQSFSNAKGKIITTINNTVPLIEDGKVIGAVEVAQDVTKLKDMTDTLINLQRENAGDQPHSDQKGIRKYTLDDIIGEDREIIHLKQRVKNIATHDYSVLISGETGTGKELFAQSIHYAGNRAGRPLLAQNCAAMPSSLLESILFGTVKGGFTGASDTAGLFEQASGGTLLLDEINAMPYDLQSKLLRVLQENYIRRIGDTKDIPVDVRVIAITNEPLEKLMDEGLFRRDLYYRLNTITLDIPPLRKRKRDIPLLADHFIRKYNGALNKDIRGITDGAMQKLMEYDYIGNIRELENIIVAAMSLIVDGDMITENDIIFNTRNKVTMNPFRPSAGEFGGEGVEGYLDGGTLPERLKKIEMEIIDIAMEENDGNITKSARQLGINRQNLQYKLRNR